MKKHFSLKGEGQDEQRQPKVQPSAKIMRVECAKCGQECDLPAARATLCGDRACRVKCRRAARATGICGDRARNAGESAICRLCAQPSAEIVRVE